MHVIEHLRRLIRPDSPLGWRISAPFVFSLELGRRGDNGSALYPLGFQAWRTIIARIAPHAMEVFLDGEEPLDHPDALPLLALCDEQGFRYHLTSRGAWAEPRLLVNRLRALKRLKTLRIHIPTAPESSDGKAVFANLKSAVDAGLNVWGLIPADCVDPERLADIVARLCALGTKGIALMRGCNAAKVYERAAELRQAGYNLALEECAPQGLAGRIPGRCRGLLGSCVVNAGGDVKSCRHSLLVLGSLLDDGIAAIWSSQKAEALRSRLADGTGTSSGLYRRGCPVEESQGETYNDVNDAVLDAAPETPAAELDPSLVPVALYRLRREPFGAVLIRGYDFFPVTHAGRRIAEAFDGHHTLLELQRKFGEQAILLAYALFCEKMLRFSRERAGAEEHLTVRVNEEAGA